MAKKYGALSDMSSDVLIGDTYYEIETLTAADHGRLTNFLIEANKYKQKEAALTLEALLKTARSSTRFSFKEGTWVTAKDFNALMVLEAFELEAQRAISSAGGHKEFRILMAVESVVIALIVAWLKLTPPAGIAKLIKDRVPALDVKRIESNSDLLCLPAVQQDELLLLYSLGKTADILQLAERYKIEKQLFAEGTTELDKWVRRWRRVLPIARAVGMDDEVLRKKLETSFEDGSLQAEFGEQCFKNSEALIDYIDGLSRVCAGKYKGLFIKEEFGIHGKFRSSQIDDGATITHQEHLSRGQRKRIRRMANNNNNNNGGKKARNASPAPATSGAAASSSGGSHGSEAEVKAFREKVQRMTTLDEIVKTREELFKSFPKQGKKEREVIGKCRFCGVKSSKTKHSTNTCKSFNAQREKILYARFGDINKSKQDSYLFWEELGEMEDVLAQAKEIVEDTLSYIASIWSVPIESELDLVEELQATEEEQAYCCALRNNSNSIRSFAIDVDGLPTIGVMDTGASDMMVNKSVSDELKERASPEDRKRFWTKLDVPRKFVLADNSSYLISHEKFTATFTVKTLGREPISFTETVFVVPKLFMPVVVSGPVCQKTTLVSVADGIPWIEDGDDVDSDDLYYLDLEQAILRGVIDPQDLPSICESLGMYDEFKELLESFKACMWTGDAPPACKMKPFKLPKNENVKLTATKPRRFPPVKMEALKAQIERLLKAGLIVKITHDVEAAAQVVVVAKKVPAGSPPEWRIAIDYSTTANRITKSIQGAIPDVRELLSIAGSGWKLFSQADLRIAYNQILLDPECYDDFAFVVGNETYATTRLWFGYSQAPAVFCNYTDRCFKKIMDNFEQHPSWRLIKYFDNLLICAMDEQGMFEGLKQMLEVCAEFGLSISGPKTEIGVSSTIFLGHQVSEKGCSIDPNRIKALLHVEVPKTQRQLKGLIGTFGYVTPFIEHAAELLAPFTSMTSKDAKFDSESLKAPLQALKDAVEAAPCLATLSYEKPIFINCDASERALGAVLWQFDDNGKPRAIEFASKKLSPVQSRWINYQRELASIRFAFKHWHHLIWGTHVIVQSDCSGAIGLKWNEVSLKVARWLTELQSQSHSLWHVAGDRNEAADHMSRFLDESFYTTSERKFRQEGKRELTSVPPSVETNGKRVEEQFDHGPTGEGSLSTFPPTVVADQNLVSLATSKVSDTPIGVIAVAQLRQKPRPNNRYVDGIDSDDEVRVGGKRKEAEVRLNDESRSSSRAAGAGKAKAGAAAENATVISNSGNRSQRRRNNNVGGSDSEPRELVNAESLAGSSGEVELMRPKIEAVMQHLGIAKDQAEMLALVHGSEFYRHSNWKVMMKTVLNLGPGWPKLAEHCHRYYDLCVGCKKMKLKKASVFVQGDVGAQHVHQIWACDIAYGPKDHRWLCVIDHFSRFVWGEYLADIQTPDVIQALQKIFDDAGKPEQLRCDAGRQFDSAAFTIWLKKNGVEWHGTTPTHHESNAICERVISTLDDEATIRWKEAGDRLTPWWSAMKVAIRTYNNTIHSATDFSPSELQFAFARNSNLSTTVQGEEDELAEITEFEQRQNRFDIGVQKLKKAREKANTTVNRRKILQSQKVGGRSDTLAVDDWALIRPGEQVKHGEFRFEGPFQVVEVLDNNVYVLADKRGIKENRTRHIQELVKFNVKNDVWTNPELIASLDDGKFPIEKIVDHVSIETADGRDTSNLRVKWCGISEPSWVHIDSLTPDNCPQLKDYIQRRKLVWIRGSVGANGYIAAAGSR